MLVYEEEVIFEIIRGKGNTQRFFELSNSLLIFFFSYNNWLDVIPIYRTQRMVLVFTRYFLRTFQLQQIFSICANFQILLNKISRYLSQTSIEASRYKILLTFFRSFQNLLHTSNFQSWASNIFLGSNQVYTSTSPLKLDLVIPRKALNLKKTSCLSGLVKISAI